MKILSEDKLDKQLIGKKLSDRSAMALALKTANKGWGFVQPNPPVACVILDKEHRFLSRAFYAHYGDSHAEIQALKKIKDKKLLDQALLFVSLEPCAHYGQNPPCVQALLAYNWKNIYYGVEDPNPKTRGKGLKILKDRGFKLKKFPYFKKELARMYEAFRANMQENRTFFALKIASSLDGVSAFSNGESRWITSAKSRQKVHELRAGFSAVLIGSDTFLQDNPRLNVRLAPFPKKNKVVLLDPLGQCLPLLKNSRLAQERPLKDIYVVTCSPAKSLANCIRVPKGQEIDLKALSYKLYKKGLSSVLVEGGIKTFAYFLNQGASSRIYQFISPCLLGGLKGRFWTESLTLSGLKNKKKLKNLEIFSYHPDIFLTALL